MLTYSAFLNLCNKAVQSKSGLSRNCLEDSVDPANYYAEDFTKQEAINAADEFADELLEECGFPA